MKKFILLLTCFFCLSTSIFAEFAPKLNWGAKFNFPSTGIQVYTTDDEEYDIIDFAGLKSTPSFAIGFDFEWYHTDYPIYGGISVDLGLGKIFSSGTGFKFGYYNNYINLFCKVGPSFLIAEMDASENVKWRYDGDSSEIESINFYGIGFNFGLGIDLHPSKGPFFIRFFYDHEICNPDVEIKTQKFTLYINSSDIIGDTDFHNRSFTISVGWQFRRKNIVKEDVQASENNEEDTVKN